MTTIFISGHLDLTEEEFREHYGPRLEAALQAGHDFVVGDAARGADAMAQAWLAERNAHARVFHMLERPRNHAGSFPLVGGFPTDLARDEAMTQASEDDIAWARPTSRGRRSGTFKNLERRRLLVQEREVARDRAERTAMPRFRVNEYEMYPTYSIAPVLEGEATAGMSAELVSPMPAPLLERYRAARKEWDAVQGEILEWIQKQERNLV